MSTPEQSSSASREAVPRRRGWRPEVGIFVRKLVNRRVVGYWQFPRGRRVHESQVSESVQPVLQQANQPAALLAHETGSPAEDEQRTRAMQSTDEGDGSTSEKTRLEAGFFVQAATPPEYMDPPGG